MQSKILAKYKHIFDTLEAYDRTFILPTDRKPLNVTLSVETIQKLKALKKKTGKSISRLIEERI